MEKRIKYLSLVSATAVCISLTACGCVSSGGGNNIISPEGTDWPPYEIDAYDTVTRNGEQIDVCICHDREAVYLYYNDERHELFDTAKIPTDEIYDYDTDWHLGGASLDDFNGDNNSDLQVYRYHSDMTESHIVWIWEEGAGYVYQANDSGFYNHIVVIDPPEDAVIDFSMYEGLWQSDEDNLYSDKYLQFDAQGNWTLTSDGNTIDEGYLWYDAEDGLTYACSSLGGAIDGGYISMEGDRLNISTCGYFNYLDGRDGQWQGDGGSNWDGEDRGAIENDFSMYEGLWLSDEINLFSDYYIQFDAKGNYQLTSNGETIDEGYLWYDAENGLTYACSSLGGAIDGGYISMEGDRLNISTCGYFNRLDG